MSTGQSHAAVDVPSVVLFLLERAERVSRRQSLESARSLYLAAVELDPTPVARISYAVELASDDPYTAIAQFKIAWDDARRLDNPQWRANCCRNLAVLFAEVGNPVVANQFRQLAVAAESETTSVAAGASFSPALLSEIVNERIDSGDLDSAIRLIRTAEDSSATGESIDRSTAAWQRGVIAVRAGRIEAAREHLLEACRLCRDERDWRSCGDLLANLGHVSQIQREYRVADRHFRASAKLFGLIGDPGRAAAAWAFAREAASRERLESADPQWN